MQKRKCYLSEAGLILMLTVNTVLSIPSHYAEQQPESPIVQNHKDHDVIEYEQPQVVDNTPVTDPDQGQGVNCGSNDTRLIFTWKPKIIDPRGSVQFSVSFILLVDVTNITATVDIHVYGDENPIFTIIQEATCEQLREEVSRKSSVIINCPLQKKTPFRYQFQNKSLTRLPTGNFTVIVKAWNEIKQEVLCLNVTLQVRRNY